VLFLIFGCPIWLPVFFLIFYNEPELGTDIDPGMALTPLPFSIRSISNPQPSAREPSALQLEQAFAFSNVLMCSYCISKFTLIFLPQCTDSD